MQHLPPPLPPRATSTALLRGLLRRCPRCGVGSLFRGYLKIRDYCPHCAERLGHIRADDGPAYFTVLIVGHLSVPTFLAIEEIFSPPLWLSMGTSIPLTLAVTCWMLPRIKGAFVGVMWAHRLRGDEHHENI